MYRILNKLSEYIQFYISKTITLFASSWLFLKSSKVLSVFLSVLFYGHLLNLCEMRLNLMFCISLFHKCKIILSNGTLVLDIRQLLVLQTIL